MTTDSTQPQADLVEQVPVASPGQPQGHRRRRRRRKSKAGMQTAAPQPQASQTIQPTQPQAAAPPPPPPQHHYHKKPLHQQQPQGGGKKRKKFFQKGSSQAPAPQPGNSIAGPMQGKRKNRQKGPREFVGPMDHSYRAANGNVADAPPATIQLGNGHGGAYYPELYHATPAIPIREDAVTHIYCFIEDLFFQAKINETAKKLGVKVEFVKSSEKDPLTRITELPEDQRPRLLVFDLNNITAKPISLIPKFKAKFKKSTSIIGFLNHLQGELKAKAVEAGCDTVMPRSAFSQSLPNLLRRYGIEDEEDNYPQPM